jgi:tryptophan 2,3-dioxygenase
MEALRRALDAPSVYDEALRLLARHGFAIPADVLTADMRRRHVPDKGVEAAWAIIYKNSAEHFDLYELAEELVDLEDAFQTWRFRHMKTVERIIGMRAGTGGSAGVPYLKSVLDLTLFPELWSVRTVI